jgi:hypothetical protein
VANSVATRSRVFAQLLPRFDVDSCGKPLTGFECGLFIKAFSSCSALFTQGESMANRLNLVLSVAIGGLAIHGVIAACGNVNSKSPDTSNVLDAQASDSATPDGTAPIDTGAPAGTIVAFGGKVSPAGWVLCDGSTVSRTTYATLFAAIGTNFGGGDGVSTFNLPDLRGRFMRGMDAGAGRDPDAASRTVSNSGGSSGDNVGSLQDHATAIPVNPFLTDNTGSHTHANGVYDRVLTHSGLSTAPGSDSSDSSGSEPDIIHSVSMLFAGAHAHRIGGGFGAGGDKETRPRNVAVNFLIKI